MKILITGIAGFVGSHFVEFFINKKNVEIFGIERKGASTKNISHLMSKIHSYRQCDIKDFKALKKVIREISPDHIIHLAAQASPSMSWKIPVDTVRTNIEGEVNLLEAVRNLNIKPRIIIAGSCDEYGLVKRSEIPIKEKQPLRPLNTYAVSKVAQDFLGYQYYKSYGMDIVMTRPFHHTGPGRPEHFVCSSFAKQIALIEKGKQKPVISVGNLNAKRDFTDVRDMVKAYWLIMRKGISGDVYNICSGKGHSIKGILHTLLAFSKTDIKIKVDQSKMRPNDIPIFIGDCSKLRRLTGWKPTIPMEQTLKDLLNYWREQI